MYVLSTLSQLSACNTENLELLGTNAHVVAPSYGDGRRAPYAPELSTEVLKVHPSGVIGECNIQYMLRPESRGYCIVEASARYVDLAIFCSCESSFTDCLSLRVLPG